MTTATFTWYGNLMKLLLTKKIDYMNDTIKVMLLKSGYTPDQDAHDYLDDVVPASNEVANGNGYATGGAEITTKSVQYISAGNYTLLVGDDSTWANATWTGGNGPTCAVLYDDTPATNATKPLIGYMTFAEQNPNGVEFKLDYETISAYNTLLKTTTA